MAAAAICRRFRNLRCTFHNLSRSYSSLSAADASGHLQNSHIRRSAPLTFLRNYGHQELKSLGFCSRSFFSVIRLLIQSLKPTPMEMEHLPTRIIREAPKMGASVSLQCEECQTEAFRTRVNYSVKNAKLCEMQNQDTRWRERGVFVVDSIPIPYTSP